MYDIELQIDDITNDYNKQLELTHTNTEALTSHADKNESELEYLMFNIKNYKEKIDFVFDIIDVGVFTYSFKNDTVFCTPRFLELTGFENNKDYEDIFSNGKILDNVHKEDVYTLLAALRAPFFNKNNSIHCLIRLYDKDEKKYLSVNVTGKYIFENDELCMIGIYLSDVTEIKTYKSKIEKLAYHDALTDLPNRTQFEEYIDLIIAKRLLSQAAFIYLNLDNFKYVNNTFGHSFGDKVIVEISNRIINFSPESMVARLGGDEFGIFYMNYRNIDEVIHYIKKLLNHINIVYSESGIRHKITASIGIALYPFNGSSFESLLKNSDIAMYHSKSKGKNMYTFFTERMTQALRDKFLLEEELTLALENKEFVLYYQPLLSVKTNRIVGFEGLIRWYSTKGIVYPNKFIGSAEENGLIIPIGYYVLEEACKFIQTLIEKGYHHVHVAVNLSPLQITQKEFVSKLFEIIDYYAIPPKNLVLEITESLLVESFGPTIEKLLVIKQRGIQISLDDFGTGYSSLTYLKDLPINTLKIDKSFIDNIAISDINLKIVAEIVKLAHILDIDTIAEGVETFSQAACLKEMGCDVIQGYLCGKPMPKTEIHTLLNTNII